MSWKNEIIKAKFVEAEGYDKTFSNEEIRKYLKELFTKTKGTITPIESFILKKFE
mgnify:CR=1 FL=1|tara:strand:- start:825 stop:989 length:165 start_codon:yes stop_codon:yes gene_type:complete